MELETTSGGTSSTGSQEATKVEAVFQHFKCAFPVDPVGAFARFFAKASCRHCNARGLETVIGLRRAQAAADLRLCACARRRLGRYVMKALLFDAATDRGGLGFAEGTVCSAAELALPVATPPAQPRSAS